VTASPDTAAPDPAVLAPARPPAADTARPVRRVPAGAVLAAVLGASGVLVLALAVGGAAPTDAPPGLLRAGWAVEWGLPVARLAARVAGIGTVGALLFAAVLLPGQGGVLPASSLQAVRAASRWASAWAAATVLTGVLTVSELLGLAPTAVPAPALGAFLTDVPAGRATVVVVVLAALVAVLARRCTRAPGAGLLLLAALAGLAVPAVLSGHSSSADDHLLAVGSLGAHVLAAAVWIGGLAALVVHGRRSGELASAAARYSAVALACFVLTGISGLTSTWVLLGAGPAGVGAALGTGYGWLLAAKVAALVVLGVLGRRHRRATLPRLHAGEPGAFRRLAGVEVGLMVATVAVAVALAASPPPAAGPAATAAAGPASGATAPTAGTGAGSGVGSGTDAAPAPAADPTADPMAGHDHGDLSVAVLVDEERFHVPGPVSAGAAVTVFNSSSTEVTITADDGSFDVVVPAGTLLTFPAPAEPGSHPFTSRHDPSFGDVLVVAAPAR
jgi:putative copper resistance protein D